MSRHEKLESKSSQNTEVNKSEDRTEISKAKPESAIESERLARNETGEKKQENHEVSNGKLPEFGAKLEQEKLDTVRAEKVKAKEKFEDFQNKRWEDSEVREQKKQVISGCMEMTEKSYDAAREIAAKDEKLRTFSNHLQDVHIPQVTEKTLAQMDQYKEAREKNPEEWDGVLSEKCSENTVIAACVCHDVGMAGRISEGKEPVKEYEARREQCAIGEPTAGEQIRKEHSVESAMYILSKHDEFDKMNEKIQSETKEGEKADLINTDEAAMIVALHSKSAEVKPSATDEVKEEKGVSVQNLASEEEILQYAEALKGAAEEHGQRFDDSFLYKEGENGERVVDQEAICRVRTEATALRQGDSFREAAEIQTTQSGYAMLIEVSDKAEKANDINEEMDAVNLAYFDRDGIEQKDMRLDEEHGEKTVETFKTKVYAAGEKNINDIRPGEVRNDGSICTDVYLKDGNFCPRATGRQIGERMRESASLDNGKTDKMVYRIHSETNFSEKAKTNLQMEIEAEISEHGLNEELPYGGFRLEFD